MEDNAASIPNTAPSGPPPVQPPPPPLAPPPFIPQRPPTTPPKQASGWKAFAIILVILLAVSLLANVGGFLGSLMHVSTVSAKVSGPRLDEVVLEDNDAKAKIAVIEITGVISGRSVDQSGASIVEIIRAQLKRAREDSKVKAVLLKVDSPGGEVLASDEIYRALSEFQECGKPVVASMGSLAASGGYYVSAPCRWIIANDLTITGSIGVIMHTWNYRGLMNKVGVTPVVFKSGKNKDMLSGERELSDIPPEEREMVQKLINTTYEKFKTIVAEGRQQAHNKNKKNKDEGDQGRALSADWKDYADGRVLSGSEACELGLVDELGNFKDAVARTKSIVGLDSADLVSYQQHYDLGDLLHLFGKSESRAIKLDLGVEGPKLEAGHLYFLAPTFAY